MPRASSCAGQPLAISTRAERPSSNRGAAVTIEPVAIALGLDFRELEVHDVELWVPETWTAHPGIRALLDLLHTASFRDRAGALPAYDLTDMGAAR